MTIEQAIERSRSHNEIVLLEAFNGDERDISSLLRYAVGNAWDISQIDRSPIMYDVWSISPNDDWRLTIVIAGT